MAEYDDRDKRRAARRIHDAGSPGQAHRGVLLRRQLVGQPRQIHQLATWAWVKAGHPSGLIGDSSTSKSHLLIGLGTEAGYRIHYSLA